MGESYMMDTKGEKYIRYFGRKIWMEGTT